MPVMGIYDESFAQELRGYIDHLDCANGLIECPQAKKLEEELVGECDALANQMESEAYRVLSYRCIVIAWLKGLRSCYGKVGKGDSTLRTWMSRGYVEWDEIAGRFIYKKR